MIITVNGRKREIAGETTVAELLESLRMDCGRVAVEHNGSILAKSRFAETALAEGDTLEIVQFVGGG